ncbi:MAG: serine/threonine-protein kinase, partial [Microbacteriaceae bacterium]
MSLSPGDRVADRFSVVEVLGRGGMSTVYRARDEQLGRQVALKVFAPGTETRLSEGRMLASLQHPAIVTILDSGESAGLAFVVMQLVEGEDLGAALERGPMPIEAVLAMAADIAAALAVAHAAGVVHRDVKPGNILLPAVREAGMPSALLGDFGIAHLHDEPTLSSDGTILGTAAYLSPEQTRGQRAVPASDVYALGLVVLEAVTGEPAFPGAPLDTLAERVAHAPRVGGEMPWELHELLREMTALDAARRPAAAEVCRRLRAIDPAGSSAPAPTQPLPAVVLPEPAA